MKKIALSSPVFGFLMSLCVPQIGSAAVLATAHETVTRVEKPVIALSEETAYNFSKLALKCVKQEFPNKMDHVMNSADEVKNPSAFHPAFYGCFDWHSSVHGHWMLVKLLKLHPEIRNAAEIRTALGQNLSTENILREVAYMKQQGRKSFERTYGWAWALKLAEELYGWEDPDGKAWSKNIEPLAKELSVMYQDFLPRQTYPIRTGVHPNTAFGIAFAYDYALKTGDEALLKLLKERAMFYYSGDKECPAAWEPGGEDFFSPCLIEADLMRRILGEKEFAVWFAGFLPGIAEGKDANLLKPAVVADRTDPKIVHLDGLNLSRAWCMYGIASALKTNPVLHKILRDAADLHAADALAHVASGNYEGEHWLASFAVYMLSAKTE